MVIAPTRAAAAKFAIFGQVFTADYTAVVTTVSRPEVAVLSRSLYTAVGHHAPLESRILVGCDVPVKRQSEVESPVLPVAQCRKKKTGFPLVGQWKTDCREIQNWHTKKTYFQVLANTNPGCMIENNLTCFHQYRIVTRHTTRIHNVFQTLAIVSLEIERVGSAPGTCRYLDSLLCIRPRIGLS